MRKQRLGIRINNVKQKSVPKGDVLPFPATSGAAATTLIAQNVGRTMRNTGRRDSLAVRYPTVFPRAPFVLPNYRPKPLFPLAPRPSFRSLPTDIRADRLKHALGCSFPGAGKKEVGGEEGVGGVKLVAENAAIEGTKCLPKTAQGVTRNIKKRQTSRAVRFPDVFRSPVWRGKARFTI